MAKKTATQPKENEYILKRGDYAVGLDIKPGKYKIEELEGDEDGTYLYPDMNKAKCCIADVDSNGYMEMKFGEFLNVNAKKIKLTLLSYNQLDIQKVNRWRIIGEINNYLENCTDEELSNALILISGLKK